MNVYIKKKSKWLFPVAQIERNYFSFRLMHSLKKVKFDSDFPLLPEFLNEYILKISGITFVEKKVYVQNKRKIMITFIRSENQNSNMYLKNYEGNQTYQRKLRKKSVFFNVENKISQLNK